jgi:hypothetical protein
MAVRKRLSMVVTIGVAELFDGHFAQVSPEDFSCLQGSRVSGVTSHQQRRGIRLTSDSGNLDTNLTPPDKRFAGGTRSATKVATSSS